MALETNSIVFAPDYRTAPEFKFPQGSRSLLRQLTESDDRLVSRSLTKPMPIALIPLIMLLKMPKNTISMKIKSWLLVTLLVVA